MYILKYEKYQEINLKILAWKIFSTINSLVIMSLYLYHQESVSLYEVYRNWPYTNKNRRGVSCKIFSTINSLVIMSLYLYHQESASM